MEALHAQIAKIAGEISLALVHGKGSRARIANWVQRLRAVADELEKTYAR